MIGSSYLGPNQPNKCPECFNFLFVGETYCQFCKTEINKCFKPDQVKTFKIEQWIDDLKTTHEYLNDDEEAGDFAELFEWFQNDTIADKYQFGEIPKYTDNVCCNEDHRNCNCKSKCSFGEAYLFYGDQFLYEKPGVTPENAAYQVDDGDDIPICRSCIHYSTFSCKSFRNWLRLNWENPEFAEDYANHKIIEPCVEYDSQPGTPHEEEMYVLNYIRMNSSKSKDSKNSYEKFLDALDPYDDDEDTYYYFQSPI